MKLRVQYTAQLRTAIGCAEEEVELADGINLAELLAHLAANRRGDAAPHLVTGAGEPQPCLLLAVNGSAVSARDARARVMHPGDVVTLMPPIAGG